MVPGLRNLPMSLVPRVNKAARLLLAVISTSLVLWFAAVLSCAVLHSLLDYNDVIYCAFFFFFFFFFFFCNIVIKCDV
jgi:hypothetical protein